MQKITLVAAIGEHNELGVENTLLWDLPIDMKHFREKTAEKTIIMGRKTFQSIGKPLPKRRNIIISRSSFDYPGIEVVASVAEALSLTNNESEIMIIGGGEIYALFLPLATHLSLTRVHSSFANADTFFPVFHKEDFELVSEDHYIKDNLHAFSFDIQEWERKQYYPQ